MAKKSAAQMKVVKKQDKPELPPIEEVFQEAKDLFIMTLETQIKTAERIDNLLNIRDLSKSFWGKEDSDSIDYYKEMQKLSVNTYKDILEASHEFELEEFLKPEIKDYYESLVPKVANIATLQDLFEATIVFLSVQPYGNKLVQMHQLIQQELAKRGELQ